MKRLKYGIAARVVLPLTLIFLGLLGIIMPRLVLKTLIESGKKIERKWNE